MEKKSPAISVIIPMYNVERYIVYCMESLLQQTFTDYEIILVDDASTDNTYRLCQSLFGDSERITVLRNPANEGQCSCRNKGLRLARGKYVYFMDSDDEILPQGLEILYKKSEEEKADVVHSNFYATVYSQGRMRFRKTLWEMNRCVDVEEGLLRGSLSERFRFQGMRSQPMPWLKLYRREFLLEEELFFPDLAISEDDMFSMAVILKAKRFVRINTPFYLYRKSFNDRERNAARLPIAFPLMSKALHVIDDIFAQYTEEELSFDLRQEFRAGWLRAHLLPWVLDILNPAQKEGWTQIESLMSSISPEYANLFGIMIYMLDNDTGLRKGLKEKAVKQRVKATEIFSGSERGGGAARRDYAWLYTKARLAVVQEGGDASYCRMAYISLGRAAFRLGKYQEALEAYQKALLYTESYSPQLWAIFSEYLRVLHYSCVDAEDISKVHKLYGEQFGELGQYNYKERKADGGKIRLGLLSPYFYRHEFFSACYGLLFCYDKNRFEVYCYHTGEVEDDYTRAIRDAVDEFISMAKLAPKEQASIIHKDGVDVLIDLAGHLPGSGLPALAYRPARIQLSAIGYPSTTGLPAVDYYLTDTVMDPPGKNDELFVEKLIYLPCRLSYGVLKDVSMPVDLPFVERGYITYGVFAPYYQLDDAMLALWRELLEVMPEAHLVVRSEDFASDGMRAEAADRFFSLGYDMKQVQFETETGQPCEENHGIDILLDTYPCSVGMRLVEALYMGVPVISLYGERRDTRMSLSILQGIGLEELAAADKQEYFEKATSLAKSPEKLAILHSALRKRVLESVMFNPEAYVHNLEEALTRIV